MVRDGLMFKQGRAIWFRIISGSVLIPKRLIMGENVNIEITKKISLTLHLRCRKQLEYLCRRMSRETVSSDMWWLQAGPSRPVASVVGGRVEMDETHQVKIHFN